MANTHKFTFVFPVYNEEPNIPVVLEDLGKLNQIISTKCHEAKFLFIDDGSTDNTVSLLKASKQSNLQVISHDRNLGPGAAFQTAFREILSSENKDNDLVITLEGDATSDPYALKRILQRLEEDDDIILASPYLYGGQLQKVIFHRVLISHIGNGLVKLFLNLRGLATLSCFFRVYRVRALRRISERYQGNIVSSKGFECAVEILIKAVRSELKISEIPLVVDWGRRKGKSKMKVWKTSIAYLALISKYNIFWGKN